MKIAFRALVAASLLSFGATEARAQYMGNTAVSSNAYITLGGLDWAWAFPLPASTAGFVINPFQASQGWRVATAQEVLNAPVATDFMFRGANVIFGGSDPISGAYFQATNSNLATDAACATPWFSTSYMHCDWQDGRGQVYDWADSPNGPSFGDQLVVRASSSVVPEPSSVILMAAGLAGLAVAARRRRKS